MTISLDITVDRAVSDRIERDLARFAGLSVTAGLHEDAGAPKFRSGELATRGYKHETGDGAPKREWMAPAFDSSLPALERELLAGARAVVDGGETAAEAMTDVGELVEDAQFQYIAGGRVGGPELSEQARKNDTRKLVDEGDMVDAIDSRLGGS